MRQSWTDERLDDGFDRVHADLRAVRGEVSSFRVETKERFDKVEERFDHWQRMFFQLGIGIFVALLGLLATQL